MSVLRSAPTAASQLAPLRVELVLYPGFRSRSGAPTWRLHDPLVNRFFQLGWLEYEILSRWSMGAPLRIAAAVERDTTLRCDAEQVLALAQFFAVNQLLRLSPDKTITLSIGQRRKLRQHWLLWAAKNYLFLRYPLVRPDAFLRRTLPSVRWLFGPGVVVVCVGLCGWGLLLVSRRWEAFFGTFDYFFSWHGLAVYGLVLVGVKVLHELAHAYASVKYGCRVSSMGVALLVLWPVLYTDTTESWKLQQRGQRMTIVAAGVLSEVFLAGVSLVIWSFAADGMVRSAAFVLSTLTLVSTLLINGNPMLRFDGYYWLSDWLDMPNLHQRSMALARWWLRRVLFGWPDPAPESYPRGLCVFLIVFAGCTMIYRFFLFLAIALLVYYFFFKALGIVLFIVEIVYFIAWPIYHELKVWYERRGEMQLNRHTIITLLSLGLGVGVLLAPWGTTVLETAIVRPQRQALLTAPLPGIVRQVHVETGEQVRAGALLFELESPDLAHGLEQSRLLAAALRWRLGRVLDDPVMLSERLVDQRRLAEAEATLRRQQAEYDRLRMVAPFSGQVAHVNPALRVGLPVPKDFEMAVMVDWTAAVIETYVRERDVSRIQAGSAARFYPEDPPVLPALRAVVEAISVSTEKRLDNPYVASQFGGSHAAFTDEAGQVMAVQAIYPVTLTPQEALPDNWPARVVRGRIMLRTQARSPAQRLWLTLQSTFIREGSF